MTLIDLGEKYNLTRNQMIKILSYLRIKKPCELVQKNARKTLLKKTGYAHPNQNPETFKKVNDTKRKNKTFNFSNLEKQIEWLLDLKFLCVKKQYKSEKYPFNCDFYIPELDLYIEIQGHWSHGTLGPNNYLGAYNCDNPKHQKILKLWKRNAKNGSNYYAQAINIWTYRDPLKRETAKRNNLNWLEFFNINQFLDWYKTQSGTLLLEYKSSIK